MSKKSIFFTLSIFITILLVAFTYYKRLSLYPYNTSLSYKYDFNNTDATSISLKLKNSMLDLSKVDLTNKTVFLEVTVSTKSLGKVFQPSIKTSLNSKSIETFFEPLANGKRYINITSLCQDDIKKVKLTPKWLEIDPLVKLIYFKKPKIKNKTILVISPHPDDAEIAAYGFYSNSNKNTYIITITAGDAGLNNYDEIYKDPKKSYFEKAKLRVINSWCVPFIGGIPVKNSLNLGYFDATLKEIYQKQPLSVKSKQTLLNTTTIYRSFNTSPLIKELTTTKNSWNSLVEDLRYLLKKIKPDIVVTPYPAIDAHPDHQYSTIAVFEAIKKLKLTNIELFLYTNHFNLCEIYPFGKMYSNLTLPPVVKDGLYFKSIYSYSLPFYKQQEKILALEAMNDIRLDTEWKSVSGSFMVFLKNFVKNIILDDDERYFRRSVKTDELFFIIDSKKLYDKKVYKKLTEPF